MPSHLEIRLRWRRLLQVYHFRKTSFENAQKPTGSKFECLYSNTIVEAANKIMGSHCIYKTWLGYCCNQWLFMVLIHYYFSLSPPRISVGNYLCLLPSAGGEGAQRFVSPLPSTTLEEDACDNCLFFLCCLKHVCVHKHMIYRKG